MQSLPKFNVDIKETSVSGFSSGAFFANQIQVAFSSIIKGVGLVAGGPYDCAGHQIITNCNLNSTPPVTMSIALTNQWSRRLIDDTSYMKNHKVYMISGRNDFVVGTSVMNQLYRYLVSAGHYVRRSNVVYKHDLPSGHTFPTDFDSPGNTECFLN